MKPSLALALTAALLVSGCGRKKEDSTVLQPVTTEPAAEAVAASPPPAQADALSAPEPSKAGLVTLCSDPNAYIRNNAKEALTSWDAQDYASAVIALQKVVSLSRTPEQQAAVASGLAQLKADVDRAAAKGNANAKEALAQMAQSGF